MRNFMHEIAKPILPSDEHLDYIPTQAVAEYLLHHHQFKLRGKPARIEGIIYRSAQFQGGKNIALLGSAAQVENPETGEEKRQKGISFSDNLPQSILSFMGGRTQPENPALRVVEQSVQVQRVGGARYDTVGQDNYTLGIDELDF